MGKFFIENYGCQMNVAEMDSFRAGLLKTGHVESQDPEHAQTVIINTCSVRITAEQRVEGRLGYYRGLNSHREKNNKINVVLLGCMAQNVGHEMKKKFPDVVSHVWGTYNKDELIPHIGNNIAPIEYLDQNEYHFIPSAPQKKHSFKAFVSIAHGCDNYCSYCIVPYVRGHEISRPMNAIIDDVKRLVDEGVFEITLLGQNVNSYRDGDIGFPQLLDTVARISGVMRLTYLTSHPKDFSLALIDVMREHSNIMPFLHLPFQAGNNRILDMMNRKYTRENYLEKIEIAKTLPGIILSTDIMVGFPTETEEEFEETLDIVKRVRYYEAFTYRYNVRPGTKAADFEEQVPEEIKLERLKRLISLHMEIKRDLQKRHIGDRLEVVLEQVSKKDSSMLTGQAHNGLIIHMEGTKQDIGKIMSVEITGVRGNGLSAKTITND